MASTRELARGRLAAPQHPRRGWLGHSAPGSQVAAAQIRDGNAAEAQGSERRLHHLPHEDRRSDDAPVGHRHARLRDVPRRGSDGRQVAPGLARGLRATTRRAKKKAHPQPRVSELWKTAANPERAYTAWLARIAGIHPVRQSRRPPRRRPDVRTVPCGGSAQRAHQHDDARARCCGRRRSTTTAATPYKNARYGESYAPDGTPQRLQAFPPPTRGRDADQGLAALPRAAAALGSHAARQRAARVRTRRHAGRQRSATRRKTRNPAGRTSSSAIAGFGTACAPIPCSSACRRRACSIPLLSFPGTNDQPGDYRGSGCTGLPRRLRQRSLAGALRRSTRSSATTAARRPSIRRSIPSATSRDIRSSTRSRARSRRASA